MSNPFSMFELQIKEQKSEIKELKEAFDIISDKLVASLQRERDLKALLTRAADALAAWTQNDVVLRELIAELRKGAQ